MTVVRSLCGCVVTESRYFGGYVVKKCSAHAEKAAKRVKRKR